MLITAAACVVVVAVNNNDSPSISKFDRRQMQGTPVLSKIQLKLPFDSPRYRLVLATAQRAEILY